MNCKKCGSNRCVKAGHIRGRQRYKCKECGCFMNRKTWLKDASCPIGKWDAV